MSNYSRNLEGVRSYTHYTSSITPSGAGSASIDLSSGSIVELKFTDSSAALYDLTISNIPSGLSSFVMFITSSQTDIGYDSSRIITWPTNFTFNGGVAPTLTLKIEALDILAFVTTNTGSTWVGNVGGLGYIYSVTPDPVNWNYVDAWSIDYPPVVPVWTYTTQKITGISRDITLDIAYGNLGQLYYKIDTTDPGDYNDDIENSPSSKGFTVINNGGDIIIGNNTWLSFGVESKGNLTAESVTVTNVTDSNAVLDTFSSYVNYV